MKIAINKGLGFPYQVAAQMPKGCPQLRVFWFTSKPLADFIHKHPDLMTSSLQYDNEQNLFYIEAKGKAA